MLSTHGANVGTQYKSVCPSSLQNLLVSSYTYNMKTTALSRELAAKPVTCEQLDSSGDVGSVIEDRVTAASRCL